jgi:hypothetical protein
MNQIPHERQVVFVHFRLGRDGRHLRRLLRIRHIARSVPRRPADKRACLVTRTRSVRTYRREDRLRIETGVSCDQMELDDSQQIQQRLCIHGGECPRETPHLDAVPERQLLVVRLIAGRSRVFHAVNWSTSMRLRISSLSVVTSDAVMGTTSFLVVSNRSLSLSLGEHENIEIARAHTVGSPHAQSLRDNVPFFHLAPFDDALCDLVPFAFDVAVAQVDGAGDAEDPEEFGSVTFPQSAHRVEASSAARSRSRVPPPLGLFTNANIRGSLLIRYVGKPGKNRKEKSLR